ncbi:MAG: alkylhydroperoxidase like protein AhpD family [Schlesneria sp.]|nr:alkylhydroperoxidase like protein AhpD family [Schlesneria sp.]
MSRLPQIASGSASNEVQELFDSVQKKLGMVPNMMRAMANSPGVLEGYLQFSNSISRGSLTAKQRQQIALAVSQDNGCDYCLAAHSTIARSVGLTADQIRDSRHSLAVDGKTNALLQFVHKVVDQRGHVDDQDVDGLHELGFTDADIAETVAHVALSVLTNYFNIVAGTGVDFPMAPALDSELAETN